MLAALIAVGLSAFGGFGGLAVAAGLCLFPEGVRRRVVPSLVSYAVGVLLGVALLDLLPAASGVLGTRQALAIMLTGIVTFFALEKLALWRHVQGALATRGRPRSSSWLETRRTTSWMAR
jgi:zinc and cadmium transporter